MTRLHKKKQQEVTRFLRWLEGKLRIEPADDAHGVEALSGKGAMKNFLGDYQHGEAHLEFATMWGIIVRNSRQIGANLDKRLEDAVRVKYGEVLSALIPLKSRLAWTDKLIDLLVYRLYGVTEQEIAEIEDQPLPSQAESVGEENVLTNER